MKQYRSPGPKYSVSTTVGYEKADPRLPKAPAYSLGQRLKPIESQLYCVPGPKYDLRNVTCRGPVTVTAASLTSKSAEPKYALPTPSPAKYNTSHCMPVVKPVMPMYSFG